MRIIVAGAGGLAIELEQYLLDCASAGRGLVNSDSQQETASGIWGLFAKEYSRLADFRGKPVIVEHPGADDPPDAHYLIAVGDPEIRRRIWKELQAKGAKFATLVHPTAITAGSCQIKSGTIIGPFAIASVMSSLGNNIFLNTYASIGHHSHAGDHCVLSPYACVNGHVDLGEACFMGSSTVVTAGRKVGAFSKVSAGSVLHGNVEPGSFSLGNPAKSRRLFAIPTD